MLIETGVAGGIIKLLLALELDELLLEALENKLLLDELEDKLLLDELEDRLLIEELLEDELLEEALLRLLAIELLDEVPTVSCPPQAAIVTATAAAPRNLRNFINQYLIDSVFLLCGKQRPAAVMRDVLRGRV